MWQKASAGTGTKLARLFMAVTGPLTLLSACGSRGSGPTSVTPTTTQATPALTLSFPTTDPDWLRSLASDYPHAREVGNVRVFSDISPGFSGEHAEHLKLVWAFFNSLYARNRGNWIAVYYTANASVFQKVIPRCPTIFIPGARNLTACYLDYPRWFIMPYQIPDLGTQLHEIGHDFLYATWPASEDFPWFKEGTAMYFESGTFDATGSLSVQQPLPYCAVLFRRYDQQRNLIPLAQLLRLPKLDFLADNERAYSQSCMLFHYLQARHPGVLMSIIDRINSGTIPSNDRLIDVLVALTAQSIDQVAEAYEAYAREVSR